MRTCRGRKGRDTKGGLDEDSSRKAQANEGTTLDTNRNWNYMRNLGIMTERKRPSKRLGRREVQRAKDWVGRSQKGTASTQKANNA